MICLKNHPRGRVFGNVNLSNLENVLQGNVLQAGPGSAFLEHLEAQIWKIYLVDANHGGTFVGLMYLLVCPRKLWICHCIFFSSSLFWCFDTHSPALVKLAMLKINLAKLYFTSSMSGFTTKQFCYISLEGGVGGGGRGRGRVKV